MEVYLEDLNISPHKKRILRLLYSGHSFQDVADIFGLSLKTIYAHTSQTYVQYDVSSLIELAFKFGWIRISPKHSDPIENKPDLVLTSPPVP